MPAGCHGRSRLSAGKPLSSPSELPAAAAGAYAAVAVPLPLPQPLTYAIPPELLPLAQPGVRVRVRVGSRRLTGVLVEIVPSAPEGIQVRPLESVLDALPVLPRDLLELARFTASYYLAPIGEVLRAILPADLPAWGQRRLGLTSAGAVAPPASAAEAAVVAVLRETGPLSAAELQHRLGLPELPAVLDRMAAAGRLSSSDRRGGSHYRTAYELAPGDREAQRQACGRSPQGRLVVDWLDALGRPAAGEEITAAVGCGASVLRRLVSLGVLRRFTEISRLDLGRHMLPASQEAAITLRPDQDQALDQLLAAAEGGRFAPFLLQGMTGSGKTEVYLRAVEAVLARGRGAILLVPEIALVPALARVARRRFGDRLAILHSNLGSSERQQEWQRIAEGEARVVLGPRSAVFAPLASLGLIVVDEEQDGAYKQETTPRYNGRDLALVRAQQAGAVALLVSATPSLESRHNAEVGKYRRLGLTHRAGQGRLPEGVLVDLRQHAAPRKPGEVHFSPPLCAEIERTLAAGQQIILLRNRRGYSPMLLCRSCGEDLRCDQCGLPRTYHRREGLVVCHYCGSTLPAPERCLACSADALEPIGTGTERLDERFRELFPGVPVDVLDRDAVRQPGGAATVLERFARGTTRVLIGTQMVSKGHHFPEVALTAVMAADTYLGFPDFRAVERTYNLLVQLAGRAGRGDVPGRVVIQTYNPEHYAIRAALGHNDASFAEEELRFRRIFHYPPYTRMVQLLLRDRDQRRGEQRLRELAEGLQQHSLARGVRFSGPAPAPLEKLRGQWRFQLLLRAPDHRRLQQLLRAGLPEKADRELVIDVDPYDLL